MTRDRLPFAPLVFTSGYLLVWGVAGVLAFGISDALGGVLGDTLAWNRGGRWLAGGVLLVAAVYELTPLKNVCLAKCRSPLGFLLG
jgi:predicted metal-binding membrane protein